MRYERPNTLKQATRLLAEAQGDAFVLAGGTDLLVRSKSDDFDADLVVDIKSIDGIAEIRSGADGISIGAAVSCAALGEHAETKAAWPGVVEAGVVLPLVVAVWPSVKTLVIRVLNAEYQMFC